MAGLSVYNELMLEGNARNAVYCFICDLHINLLPKSVCIVVIISSLFLFILTSKLDILLFDKDNNGI